MGLALSQGLLWGPATDGLQTRLARAYRAFKEWAHENKLPHSQPMFKPSFLRGAGSNYVEMAAKGHNVFRLHGCFQAYIVSNLWCTNWGSSPHPTHNSRNVYVAQGEDPVGLAF